MKKTIKRILSYIPGGSQVMQIYSNLRFRIYYIFKNREDLFTAYYKNRHWGCQEVFSGPGSTVEYTENIRKEIPRLIKHLRIQRILDAPCGDYNWFNLIPREQNIAYTGADIVEPLISRNQNLYKNENTDFIKLDITNDRLPDADLWICRDCLLHFSDKDIIKTINNFFGSNIRYLLTSTYTESDKNKDIATGKFRFLNLNLPPFNFCEPLLFIDDWIKGHPVKKMGLWEKDTLYEALVSNKSLIQKEF